MVTEYTLPPHNIEAEKWVISWALIDNETIWVFEWDGIVPGDFYQKEHSMIYEAIVQLRNDKKTIDPVTVSDQLSKNWNLESVWWIDYLYELSAFLISSSSCVEYSKIVKEKSLLRQVLKVCQQITWDAYEQKDTVETQQAKGGAGLVSMLYREYLQAVRIRPWSSRQNFWDCRFPDIPCGHLSSCCRYGVSRSSVCRP